MNIFRLARQHAMHHRVLTAARFNSFGGRSISNTPNNDGRTEFKPIYKFPFIQTFSLVNRLKLYHSVLAGVALPASCVCTYFNLCEIDAVMFTTAFGVSGCMVLYTFGYFLNKFVGFIYLHKDGQTVKISYVDFWGNRNDIVVPIEDIVPLSDLSIAITDSLYLPLNRFSTKDSLKINVKYGFVLDRDSFAKVFNA